MTLIHPICSMWKWVGLELIVPTMYNNWLKVLSKGLIYEKFLNVRNRKDCSPRHLYYFLSSDLNHHRELTHMLSWTRSCSATLESATHVTTTLSNPGQNSEYCVSILTQQCHPNWHHRSQISGTAAESIMQWNTVTVCSDTWKLPKIIISLCKL